MGKYSKIDWCTATWDLAEGCMACSPGCRNCWAETLTELWSHRQDQRGTTARQLIDPQTGRWNGRVVANYDKFTEPTTWRKPQRIFVASRTDIALRNNQGYIANWALDKIPTDATQHKYLALTKRPEMLSRLIPFGRLAAHDHVWLGVTVCNQDELIKAQRLMELIPARHYFLCLEPLLESVDLRHILQLQLAQTNARFEWVILGGESGSGSRPIDPATVRHIHRQCFEARVPLWFKQWGGPDHHHEPTEIDGLIIRQMPFALALPGEESPNGGTFWPADRKPSP